jgi:hypothetical protein
MPVEFDQFSQPVPPEGEQPGEALPTPDRLGGRRKWIAIACAGGAAVLLGGGAVAIAATSASALPGSAAAAASSSAASSSPAAKPTGGPGGRRGGGFGPMLDGHPLIAGTVKSVSGTKIVVTDRPGFTRTIVTSSKTTSKDGLTAAPAVGTKVVAIGAVDADGTSLDATTIAALPKFGGAGGRPGGPGGAPKARPSGAPRGVPTAKPTGSFTGHPDHPGRPAATATVTVTKTS